MRRQLARGYINADPRHLVGLALLITPARAHVVPPNVTAVLPSHAIFQVIRRIFFKVFCQHPGFQITIIRMDNLLPHLQRAWKSAGFITEHGIHRAGPLHFAGCHIPFPQCNVACNGSPLQPFLLHTQRFLGLLTFESDADTVGETLKKTDRLGSKPPFPTVIQL